MKHEKRNKNTLKPRDYLLLLLLLLVVIENDNLFSYITSGKPLCLITICQCTRTIMNYIIKKH